MDAYPYYSIALSPHKMMISCEGNDALTLEVSELTSQQLIEKLKSYCTQPPQKIILEAISIIDVRSWNKVFKVFAALLKSGGELVLKGKGLDLLTYEYLSNLSQYQFKGYDGINHCYKLIRNDLSSLSIIYKQTDSQEELQQILALQKANLYKNISLEVASTDGFVFVEHTFDKLSKMCGKYGHTIALYNGEVVGYALVMLNSFGQSVPELVPMFNMFDLLSYQDKPLKEWKYYVMGQVCVGKTVRGIDVFDQLYRKQAINLRDEFDLLVTEIATRNERSLNAHYRVGFKTIHIYFDPSNNEEWHIVVLEL